MNNRIVQIYEVQTREEAESLVGIGVDHLGSVLLSADEWRQPAIRAVADFARENGGVSSLIPLFQDPDRIAMALDYYRPHIVHFCDALIEDGGAWESVFRVQAKIKEWFPEIKAMRSIPIGPPGRSGAVPSLLFGCRFAEISDFFLTDTLLTPPSDGSESDQPVSGFVGITGKVCDWDVAADLVRQSAIPVILAGGISPENVVEGIRRVRPAGVDSCTCTNAVDEQRRPVRFRKDMDKVHRLVTTVRRIEI